MEESAGGTLYVGRLVSEPGAAAPPAGRGLIGIFGWWAMVSFAALALALSGPR